MSDRPTGMDGDELRVAVLIDEMATALKDASCLAKRLVAQHRHTVQKRSDLAEETADASSSWDEPAEMALKNARRELASLERRRRVLDDGHLFGDPAWCILVDLYVRQRCALRTVISSACLASGAPTSTGLRYVKSLQDDGWLMKRPDPHDLRRTYIELTPEGMDRMTDLMASDAEPSPRLAAQLLDSPR